MSYPFAEIEKRWQQYWEENETFKASDETNQPKYYVLDMFPYPSGQGLHVGHPEGYTATDIVARYKRSRGYNVLHPMGWDAFGLPAERYAMQTGIHPAETTAKNIDNFRRQLKALGFSYDWSREISTTDPDYYKWTQWIFLKIYNSYYDENKKQARPVSELKIPAAIEKDPAAKEDYVKSKRLAYIHEAPVNFCPELGTVLANEEVEEWTSKGYEVVRKPMKQWMLRITAYADRLLDDLKYVDWPAGTLELQKNWIGRSEGATVHFALKENQEKLEVFTTRPDTLFGATYMALAPEHALVNQITTKEQSKKVKDYQDKTAKKSDRDRMGAGEKTEKTGVFTGAYAINPLNGEEIPVWIADYVLMGYGTGAIMAVPGHDERDFEFAKKFDIPVKRVVAKKEKDADLELKEAYSAEGVAVNSDFINGMKTAAAKKAVIEKLEKDKTGERKINYRLRDWLFSRQRYWGEPIPVSFDEDGKYIHEDENNLPLELPPSNDFKPAETGESPLARLNDWLHYKDKEGRKLRRETNTMPQWAGSCWYYLRFADPENNTALISEEKENYWLGDTGVDLYIGGAEHAVLHLLYSRFWHKILYDYGIVSHPEPFHKLVHQGIILGEDGQKMSKSRGNVVNPDDVVSNYGADAFRLYEMFMGPLEVIKPWASNGIEGVFRFLSRVWRLYTDEAGNIDPKLLEEPPEDKKANVDRVLHQTIAKVTDDIEKLNFNTAISQLMVFVNEVFQLKSIGKQRAETFLILLAPFAPHIAEELWQKTGQKESVSGADWPAFNPELAKENEIEIVFQVNGKVRSKAKVAVDTGEEDMKKLALSDENVKKHTGGKEPRKIIVVKGKIVNIVV